MNVRLVHTLDPSTWEAKANRRQRITDQLALHNEAPSLNLIILEILLQDGLKIPFKFPIRFLDICLCKLLILWKAEKRNCLYTVTKHILIKDHHERTVMAAPVKSPPKLPN